MNAAVLQAHGDRCQIEYITDYPDPIPGPDEVVLRVAACAVNFHDIFTRRGMPGIAITFPLVTGSDVAGEIVRLGEAVRGWAVGHRVLVDPIRMTGTRPGMIGETSPGGRAELLAVHVSQLVRLPNNVSFVDAASLPLAYGTAHRMMVTRGAVTAGERVLVLGASGGVGTGCVLLAKRAGCEVIACASSSAKLTRLRGIGADHVINYREDDFRTEVYRICGKPRVMGGGGVDVVVNFTGGATWVDSLKCLTKGGRLLTCGATAGFAPKTDIRYIWTFEQQIIGSDGWTRDDLEALLRLVSDGTLSPVIDTVLPLSEAREAERLLEDREVFGKVILTP